MIPDRIRRVATRDLPNQIAAIQINGGEHTVGRLDEWQTIDREAASTTGGTTRRRPRSARGSRFDPVAATRT